uniref:E3 ubiquitin ligase RNF157-like n=1 Tax=Pristiophorus japonicus TaxID=55135 RepID=UPI00398E5DD0
MSMAASVWVSPIVSVSASVSVLAGVGECVGVGEFVGITECVVEDVASVSKLVGVGKCAGECVDGSKCLNADGYCSVKPLKQKQVVDGVSYLLQEIYGIENKYNSQESKVADDELSDNSAECVVCLSDVRDTLILPCRHLCLCNACADTLRYQANNCPICRLPFRALLQIRAMRKKLNPLTPSGYTPVIASQVSECDDHSSSDHIPSGYEAVSLLEALNGPLTPSPSAPPIHRIGDGPDHSPLPSFGPEGRTLPVRAVSPLERVCDSASQALKLNKSTSKSLLQNSSILHEEDEEKSFCNGQIPVSPRKPSNQEVEDCGVTPESENVTLSSSGAVDQSSCTGTPLSSTITSPEDSVDQDAEGNAVAKEQVESAGHDSGNNGWWLGTVTALVSDNNNVQPSLRGLDNQPCPHIALPGTPLTEERIEHPLSIPSNTELEDGRDLNLIYGPLVV